MCKRTVMPTLSLVLIGVLSACSETGVNGVPADTPVTQTAAVQAPASVRPSLSAAQLSDDSTVTVQAALALSAETDAELPVPEETPAAANPIAVNPLAPVENTDESDPGDSAGSEVPDAPVDSQNAAAGDSADPSPVGNAEPDSDSEGSSDTPSSESGSDTPDNSDTEQVTQQPEQQPESQPDTQTSEPADSETDSVAPLAQTSFTSVTDAGFTGEVVDDAIRISWQADPEARGYNVYKQAEYHTTVFDTHYVDTDVYDGDYYYEIQAFDFDDTLYYIATGLTVSPSTLGRTDPDAPQPNDELLKDYELVFADEFTNLSLDTSKWNTSFLWGTDLFINSEEQYYVDVVNDPDFGYNPFTFDGENITINTIETPDELSAKALNQPYLSGIITSYDAFKFTYGYVETRAKFTHGRGYWPAFWLLNAYYVDASPEIDIMEFIGHNQDVVYHTYHYFDAEGQLRSTKSFPVPGIDYTADFHTFGVEWKPGTLIFYIDGLETHRIVDANVSQQEMYVIANQAVGGWWAGSPDATTPLPGKYVIDYIRVYQRTTAYEDFQFDQSTDLIPLFTDSPGEVIPNKRPPLSLWPEGYPQGQ